MTAPTKEPRRWTLHMGVHPDRPDDPCCSVWDAVDALAALEEGKK